MKAELVVDCRNSLGEMPVWDPAGARLWWIDVPAPGRLFHFTPGTGEVEFFQFKHAVTGLARAGTLTWLARAGTATGLARSATDGLLLAGEREVWFWNPSTQQTNTVFTMPDFPPLHRFNDGAVDAVGRFWVGSMPNNLVEPFRSATHLEATGRLFAISGAGSAYESEPQFACPNAICWSPDGTVMYAADSVSGWIHAYDFDSAAGQTGSRRPFCRLDGLGIPDGAAVDSDGYLWNARWGAGVIAKIDPLGRLAATVALPVTNPTACCFGGADRQTLFVTSARYGLNDEQLLHEQHAGGVFAIETTSRGLPTNTFNSDAPTVARQPQNNDSR